MVWRSDKNGMRTFDESRGLELIYQPVREAMTFKILKNGREAAAFDGTSESRELTDTERCENPGFDRFMIWHVHSRGGQIEDPKCPGKNIRDEVIAEALSAFQALYGTAGFLNGKYLHALVEVEFDSPRPQDL